MITTNSIDKLKLHLLNRSMEVDDYEQEKKTKSNEAKMKI